jgi:hypothetical protein
VYSSEGTADWAEDRGDEMINGFDFEYVMMADADGDGLADLITGERSGRDRVEWWVRQSNACSGFFAGCFRDRDEWAGDFGNAGDLFRVGYGNDGQADIFLGRPEGMVDVSQPATLLTTKWFARLSNGSSFEPATVWREDAGDEGDTFP